MDPDHTSLPISPSPSAAALETVEFDFSCAGGGGDLMTAADELFFEGKLLPFWETPHLLKKSISLKKDISDVQKEVSLTAAITAATPSAAEEEEEEQPSPRPPKCTVLWKELLKLRRQKSGGSLSTSSSTSSSSSEGWGEGVKKKIRVVMPAVSSALPLNPNPSFFLPFISFRQRRRRSSSTG